MKYEYNIIKFKIKKNNEYYGVLNDLTYKANNLYNHANFIIRQNFLNSNKEKGKFIDSIKLTKIYCKAKNHGKTEFSKSYYDLPYTNLQQIEVKPKHNYLLLNAIYRVEVEDNLPEKPHLKNIMGIDLGLNNLAAITFTNSEDSYLINGKGLKSKNIYFNYKIANLKSVAKKRNNKDTSNQIKSLYEKRDNCMNDYLHKTSRKIVDLAKQYDIDTVIIGHNINQKQSCKLKNFVQIPIFKLYQLLEYKLNKEGIHLIEVEESYTSGTSYLDNELPTVENYKPSRRTKRGLLISNQGIKINSDINGSKQIMKKIKAGNNINLSLNPKLIVV